MGRPSQRRTIRVQSMVTPEIQEWLQGQAESGKSMSDVVFDLLRESFEERQCKMQKIMSETLESFLDSPDFGEGCKSATKASWRGSGYIVELFPDGTWRVLWDNEIGNKYESPGVILGLPTLDDDDDYQECVINGEWTEDEFFLGVFQNDEEELKQEMRDKLNS